MTHDDKFAHTATALLTHPAVLGLINADTLHLIVGPYAAAPLATALTQLLNQHHSPAHDPPTSAW
jgi:hypothetical protein